MTESVSKLLSLLEPKGFEFKPFRF
ncbi:hypothetical protein NGEG_04888, partial [Neisseria gonorrhoeae FA19]